ncbi:MAG: hypothetical protein AAF363_09425 [Bacteroidota bacterium]
MTNKILAITTNKDIQIVLERLINEQWEGVVVSSLNECMNELQNGQYAILLIGSGLEETEELKLEEYVRTNGSGLKIVKHYGGGSGLLTAEIHQALEDH